jgi:hypothetical protein
MNVLIVVTYRFNKHVTINYFGALLWLLPIQQIKADSFCRSPLAVF